MNPLPRPAVFGAAMSLFGASLLGLYIGVHDSLSRPGEAPDTASVAVTTALRPGMAATLAQPIKPEALAPSSAPAAKLAQAKTKAASSDDAADQDDDVPDSSAPATRHAAPQPPPLYSPDAPPSPPPPPPSQDNTPPF